MNSRLVLGICQATRCRGAQCWRSTADSALTTYHLLLYIDVHRVCYRWFDRPITYNTMTAVCYICSIKFIFLLYVSMVYEIVQIDYYYVLYSLCVQIVNQSIHNFYTQIVIFYNTYVFNKLYLILKLCTNLVYVIMFKSELIIHCLRLFLAKFHFFNDFKTKLNQYY